MEPINQDYKRPNKVQVSQTYAFVVHDTDSCDECDLYPYCDEMINDLECGKKSGYYILEDEQVKIVEE